jgi:hypothetical protein
VDQEAKVKDIMLVFMYKGENKIPQILRQNSTATPTIIIEYEGNFFRGEG